MVASVEGYVHEAMLYTSREVMTANIADFALDGLARHDSVMIALRPADLADVRDRLGSAAGQVALVDMTSLGANPARIIPAWQRFLDDSPGAVRGVGEPIWSGRRPAEITECALHEDMLNVAFNQNTPFRLRCPYDVAALPSTVIDKAFTNHIQLIDATGETPRVVGRDVGIADVSLRRRLPDLSGVLFQLEFEAANVDLVKHVVRAEAGRYVDTASAESLALSVHELAVNSIAHAGGGGVLRLYHREDALTLEVSDKGQIADLLVGRVQPTLEQERGRGMWLVNQLCDLVQVASDEQGTTVRIHHWL